MYVSYDFYKQTFGGTIPEDDFSKVEAKAEAVIGYLTGLRLRLPGSFRRRGFQPDLLMPQGALLRRGRSDSFTSAKPEEDAVGNQCRIRQKGGIVSWRYFTLQ